MPYTLRVVQESKSVSVPDAFKVMNYAFAWYRYFD